MRLVVHIGIPKTGTTVLQEYLARHRHALVAHGLWYPASAPGESGHRHIARYLRDAPRRLQDAVHDAVAEARAVGATTTLLSSEAFSVIRRPEAVRAFAESVDGVEVTVLGYVRRQDHYVLSAYSQSLRHPDTRETGSIHDFYLRRMNQMRSRLDYLAMARIWAAAFGREAVVVRPYELDRLTGGDIVDDFFEVIGVPEAAGLLRDGLYENRRLSTLALAALRRVNGVPADRDSHMKVVARMHEVDSELGHDRYLLMTGRMAADLVAAFAPPNTRLAEEFLGRSDGVLFEEAVPDAEADPVPIDPDAVTRYLAALAIRLS